MEHMNALDILHNTSRAMYMKHMSTALTDSAGEAMTYILLSANMIISESKSIAEGTLSGFPAMAETDGRGEFTSRGTIDQQSVGIVLSKQGSVLDIKNIDLMSITNVGKMNEIMTGVTSQAKQGMIRTASHLLNNLDTGLYRTFNNETPGMYFRPSDSIYVVNGKNIAENMGAAEFSRQAVLHAMTKVDSHQSRDLTTIPNRVLGCIVSRQNYRNAIHIVTNEKLGSDFDVYKDVYGMPIGLVDFYDERTWVLLTTAARIGWAVFSGSIFPSIFMTSNPETENAGIVTKWYHKPFALLPYGFFLNKFSA